MKIDKKDKEKFLEIIDASLIFILLKTASTLKGDFNNTLKNNSIDLTTEQWIVLYYVYKLNGKCQREIADITGKDKPTITRILDNLEKKKLVKRTSDKEDRRKFIIYATCEGKKIIDNSLSHIAKSFVDIEKKLSKKELDIITDILKKILIIFILIVYIFYPMSSYAQNSTETYKTSKFFGIPEIDSQKTGDEIVMPAAGLETLPMKDLSDEEVEELIFESFKLPEKPEETEGDLAEQEKEYIEAEISLFEPTCPKVISLEECLKIALGMNFDLRIITAQKDFDKWDYREHLSSFIPSINYEFIMTDLNGIFLVEQIVPDETNATTLVSNFVFSVPLFNLGLIFKTKAAKKRYESSKRELEFTKDELILKVTEQYYRVLQNKIDIDILKVNLDQTVEQLRINTQKYKAGIGTKFDVLRTEAEVALSEQELLLALNRLRFSQAQLSNLMGIPVFSVLVPKEELISAKTLLEEEHALEYFKTQAFENRDDLEAARINVEAARATRNATTSIYAPEIYVRGQLGHAGATKVGMFPNRFIALDFRWNGAEGLGFRGVASTKKFSANVRKAKFTRDNLGREIEEDIVQAYYNTLTAKEVIKTTKRRALSAIESRRLSVIRLEAGIGTFIDVLQAQANATEAKTTYLAAIIEYNISQAQLLFDMGAISVNNVLQGFDVKTSNCNPPNQNKNNYQQKEIEHSERVKKPSEFIPHEIQNKNY